MAAAEGCTASEDVRSLRKAILLVNTLTKELDIHAAMESVRHVALELLECDRVTLFLVIESRRELRGRTGPGENDMTITVKFGEGVAGTVAQEGGLMNIPDAYSHPLFNPEIDRLTSYTTRSILCCAIHDMSGKIVAVVQALNKHSGTFTKADEEHIQLFGVHLGNTLAKSKFFEEGRREKERLTTLSNCFKRLNAVTSLNGALDTMAVAVKQLVCAEHVCVLLMDNARKVLWTSITNEHTRGSPCLVRVREGEGIIGGCASDKQQLALCFAMDQASRQDATLQQLYKVLSGRSSALSEVLLQPVLDGTTDAVMAVLAAFNKSEAPSGSELFYEPTFTHSDSEALGVFSMEVADVLAARAVEVSFASALSIVLASSGTGSDGGGGGTAAAGAGAGKGAAPATPGAAGGPASGGGATTAASSASALPGQLSSMLKAQLLDYGDVASTSMGGGGHHHLHPQQPHPALQHSHTFATGSMGQRAGSRQLSGGSMELAAFGLTLDTAMRNTSSSSVGPLRRFSSTSVGSRANSLSSSAMLSPKRSFHHQLPELPDGQDTDSSSQRRRELLTWDLDCGALDKEQLVRVAYDIFVLSGVIGALDIPESELSGFLGAVAGYYRSPAEVAYHNFGHAVGVLHAVWMMLETTDAQSLLSPEEELVLLIAAICHDLEHDGHTNSFHINSQSPLAQRYNDRSVQENHHCALTFAVLAKRGSNLLCRFTEHEEFFAARRLLIDAILATDMHHHFALTQEVVAHGLAFAPEDDADRALLMKAMLHAADIGNHIRPWPLALAAAERVHEEFRRQVARERQQGLPVSPHMDAPESAWYNMEVSFIDYIAGPLWERLAQIFPALQEPLQHMRLNRAKFAALAQSSTDLAAQDAGNAGAAPDDAPGGARHAAAAAAAAAAGGGGSTSEDSESTAHASTSPGGQQGGSGGQAAASAAAAATVPGHLVEQDQGRQQQAEQQQQQQDCSHDYVI